MTKQLYTAKEVAELCGISESSAYKIIARLNRELKDKGYLTFSGKVSRATLVSECMAVLPGTKRNESRICFSSKSRCRE